MFGTPKTVKSNSCAHRIGLFSLPFLDFVRVPGPKLFSAARVSIMGEGLRTGIALRHRNFLFADAQMGETSLWNLLI
jgi:hypothetical protein